MESYIISASYVIVFALGILIHRFCLISSSDKQTKPSSFLKKSNYIENDEEVKLDEKKVVLSINTDSFEKKTEIFGTTTTCINDVETAVNKLKKMKGK